MECNIIWSVITHDAASIWITWPQYCMMKYCSDSQVNSKYIWHRYTYQEGEQISINWGWHKEKKKTIQKILFNDQQLILKVIIKETMWCDSKTHSFFPTPTPTALSVTICFSRKDAEIHCKGKKLSTHFCWKKIFSLSPDASWTQKLLWSTWGWAQPLPRLQLQQVLAVEMSSGAQTTACCFQARCCFQDL